MAKNIYVIIVSFFVFQFINGQDWSRTFTNNCFTISSPHQADLNQDGVDDIVIGGGWDDGIGGTSNMNGYMAVNGANGEVLWNLPTQNQVFISPIFQDVNGDGIPDVFMGGRRPEFRCINGASGAVIWDFSTVNSGGNLVDPNWWNFYSPQWIPDQNGDGLLEMLVANGGNHAAAAWDSLNRPVGRLVIIDPVTGLVMHYAEVPDGEETYMSPLVHDFFGQGKLEVIFGTGGETFKGSLWRADLDDIINGTMESAVIIAENDREVGFIGPPVLVDMNEDNVADIVAHNYEGEIIVINGVNNEHIYEVTISDEILESVTTPAVGFITEDNIPDIFSFAYVGIAPAYSKFRQVLVDGATGEIIWQDSIGQFYFASPVTYDLDSDGRDEVIMSIDNKFGEFPNLTYTTELLSLDFGTITGNQANAEITTLYGPVSALNINSVPLIADLDHDNLIDIVHLHSVIDPFQNGGLEGGTILNRLETNYPVTNPIVWGAYLGSDFTGYYPNPYSSCDTDYVVTVSTTNNDCFSGSSGTATVMSTGCPNPADCDYLWSSGQNTHTISNLPAGRYYVRVTHPDGCIRVVEMEVTEPVDPGYGLIATPTTCAESMDGSIGINNLNPAFQYNFLWSNGNEEETLENVGIGTYSVAVHEILSNCVYNLVEDIVSQSSIIVTPTINDVSCNGGNDGRIELAIASNLPYTIDWDNMISTDVYVMDELTAGDDYTVFINDELGCSYTQGYSVTQPEVLTLSASSESSCFGEEDGSIILNYGGGVGPYTPIINGVSYPSSFSSIFIESTLNAGDYTVQVLDANGCANDSEITILDFNADIVIQDASAMNVSDGSFIVNINNNNLPVFIVLNNSESIEPNELISGLSWGSYDLMISHGQDCVKDTTIMIGYPLGIADNYETEINLFPNPVVDEINLIIPANFVLGSGDNWKIWSSSAQLMEQGVFNDVNHKRIKLAQKLPLGLYFLELNLDGHSILRKIQVITGKTD